MYEGIIDALMKLFALMIIHRKSQANVENAKDSVKNYLKSRYNSQLSKKYFTSFENYYRVYSENISSDEKLRYSTSFIEVCEEINDQYNFEIKVNLVLNLTKFSLREKTPNEEEIDFLDHVANSLRLEEATYSSLKNFVLHGASKVKDTSLIRIVKGEEGERIEGVKYIINPNQVVEIQFLWLSQPNLLVVRYNGDRNMYINGHKMLQDIVYIFPPGSMIKTSRIQPVYQSDIMASYIQKEGQARIVYTAENVEYKFNRNQIGLHRFNFRETSGHFVGILGGSGVGKTTLINVLNGNLKPTKGHIRINGHDLHDENAMLKGIIGYVPQDDLLIEELTVYQNLYYNAKLCFSEMGEKKLNDKVEASLLDFDLVEARDLIVGNPMKKVLSGGQRKRLNIALELMREPLVLLADEPTSGLSSMDTEKVVSLLKRQCLKGSLVLANIHQPGSDIYKQFDRIIVMDKGGRVVYSGNPLDAMSYFKRYANYINPEETECPSCGNIKAEQPLRILEARMVSPTGRFMRERKVTPHKWFKRYAKEIEPNIIKDIEGKQSEESIPKNTFKTPGKWDQIKTFFKRDLLSKLTNKQYLLIAALEAPLLAFLFSFFAKTKEAGEYVFAHNSNLQSYLFMSVVVALFIGMSISAEEIFKDRLILKREAFLNLSRSSYLTAKISIVFIISAVQMLIYVLVANNILEIKGMTFYFWLGLFSTACFANILALNLSAGLKSIVAIYILIPLMLIPQLLFSGVIVDFQNMNHASDKRYTPAIADVMTARWAYEAIAVEQFKANKIQKYTFDEKLDLERSNFTVYYRIPEIENIIYTIEQGIFRGKEMREAYYTLLQNEMSLLSQHEQSYPDIKTGMSIDDIDKVKEDLDKLSINEKHKNELLKTNLENKIVEQEMQLGGKRQVELLKSKYVNDELEEALTGRYSKDKFEYYNNHIIQKDNPVFHISENKMGRSHFYAPYKYVFGHKVDVMIYNISIIWLMIIALAFILYTDLLRRIIDYFENLNKARSTRHQEKIEERERKQHLTQELSRMQKIKLLFTRNCSETT